MQVKFVTFHGLITLQLFHKDHFEANMRLNAYGIWDIKRARICIGQGKTKIIHILRSWTPFTDNFCESNYLLSKTFP